MANPFLPWAAYRALMECRLVALDKSPGVRLVGIGDAPTGIAKLVMRAAGYQSKMSCGNLQLCAGLKASIEGETQAVGQQRLKRSRAIQREE